MAIQNIRLFGDSVLRTPAQAVLDVDKEPRTLVADLPDTMRDARALKAIREAEWAGEPGPIVKISPHTTRGTGR